jgi:hypothetical protein
MERDEEQRVRDDEHLKLLAIFHYVFAGGAALMGLFPLLHVALGLAMASGKLNDETTGKAPRKSSAGRSLRSRARSSSWASRSRR